MKNKRLFIILSFIIPIFILTGLALWIVTTDHVITPSYDANHSLAQYFIEETNVTYNEEEQNPEIKITDEDFDVDNFINTVSFYYKSYGTVGKYTEGLPTDAGNYSVKILKIIDSNDDTDNQEGALYVKLNIEKANPIINVPVSASYTKQTDCVSRNNYFVTSQSTNDIEYNGSFTSIKNETLTGNIKFYDDASSLQVGTHSYKYIFEPNNSNYNSYIGNCEITTYATVLFNVYVNNSINKDFSSKVELSYGETLNKPTLNLTDYYTFDDNWYYNNNLYNFDNIVTNDMILVANLSLPSYSISYELNGGINNKDNPTSYTPESDTFNLAYPTKSGYEFIGWIGADLAEKTKDVTISKGSTGDRVYTANWAKRIKLSTIDIDYTKNIQWNTFNGTIRSSALNKFTDENNNAFTDILLADYTITGMDNGYYYYDSTTLSTNVIGSTYLVNVKLSNEAKEKYALFDVASKTYGEVGSAILKVKTVFLNNDSSTLYTIEEAINNGGKQTINLVGGTFNTNGKLQDNTYVHTSFTALTANEGNTYGVSHIINGRTLLIPYTNSTSEKVANSSSQLTSYVYSVLTVPIGVTLTFQNNATLVSGAEVIHGTKVYQHGVLMNYGNINLNSGCNLKAYGYIKGDGLITLNSGAKAIDCMRFYDWPGGNAAFGMYSSIFPINAWSVHNVSCNTKVHNGATYYAYAYVETSLFTVDQEICVLGSNSTSGCLFKPVNSSGNDYIIKGATHAKFWEDTDNSLKDELVTIKGSNQIAGQKDVISLSGKYTDSSLTISVTVVFTVNMNTSTSKPAPLGFVDVNILSGTTLNLKNSDYQFYPGTTLKIEKNATVNTSSGVDLIFSKYDHFIENVVDTYSFDKHCVDKDDAKLILNGTLNSSGNIAGKILTTEPNAILNISGGVTSNTKAMYSTESPYYFTSPSFNAVGKIDTNNDDLSNFISKPYVSTGFTNNAYWTLATNGTKFTLNFNDGSITESKDIYVFGTNSYTITGDEHEMSKDHYTFKGWTLDSSNINSAVGYTLTTSSPSINLYAKWDKKVYTFTYSAGYGVDEYDRVNYLSTDSGLNYSEEGNKSFTIDDFVDGKIMITQGASYTNPDDQKEKFFDGWYVGVDKSSGVPVKSLSLEQVALISAQYGTNIPLFCDFTDYIVITIVDNAFNGVISGNNGEVLNEVNTINYQITTASTSLADNNFTLTINSNDIDSSITAPNFFAGFSDGTSSKIYTLDEVLNYDLKENTTFTLQWGLKKSFSVSWSGNGVSSASYNNIALTNGATYYVLPSVTSLEIKGSKGLFTSVSYKGTGGISITSFSGGRLSTSYTLKATIDSSGTIVFS